MVDIPDRHVRRQSSKLKSRPAFAIRGASYAAMGFSLLACFSALANDVSDGSSWFLDRKIGFSLLNHGDTFNVEAGTLSIGKTEAYVDTIGAFVRLESMLPLLGISVVKADINGIIKITLRDGMVLTLDSLKRTYSENDRSHDIYDYELIKNENDVYVNISLLNRMLPTAQFVVDQANRSIRIPKSYCGDVGEWCQVITAGGNIAPAPQAAATAPVIIDSQPSEHSLGPPAATNPALKPEETDVIHLEQKNPPAPAASVGNTDAYVDSAGTFVGLESLLPLVGISVKKTDTDGIIKITLKDGTVLALDSVNSTYSENDHDHDIYDHELVKRDSVIYVSISLLNRMLPTAQFSVDPTSHSIHVPASFCGTVGEWCQVESAPISDIAPAPQSAPTVPVLVDGQPAPQPIPPSEAPRNIAVKPEETDIIYPVQKDESALAEPIGKADAYVDTIGTFVRLESLLPLLGISVEREGADGIIKITLKDETVLMLDSVKHTYSENEHFHDISDHELINNKGVVYVSISLLNRMLPTAQFVVDPVSHGIRVQSAFCGNVGEWCQIAAPGGDIGSTAVQVIVDGHLPEQIPTLDQPANFALKREEADVVHLLLKDGATSAEPPENPPETANEEEILILQPRIKKLPSNGNFIEAVELSSQIFVPLNDFVQLFGFPIKIDKETGTARGYFYESDNAFVLNLDKNDIQIGDRHVGLTPQTVRKRNGDIYVSVQGLDEWFGIKSDINRKDSIIHFMTDKLLPEEERDERQKRWEKILARTNTEDNEAPLLQNPYQAWGYPVFDVDLGTNFIHSPASTDKASSSVSSSTYNIQGAADLAYMTTQVYAQGATQGDILNTFRLQAGRKDPSSGLLGGLQATEFNFGDVTSPSLTLVTSNSLGRGFNVSNRALNASENFDVRSLTGDSIPGYQAELYRNNELISFQTVDANGRYNFVDIPILYGENVFRILLYGPDGQREERIETVSAAGSLLKKNQFEYTVGLDERGLSLIPVTPQTSTPITPIGWQGVAGFRYGINSDLTVGAATAETKLNDGYHRYVTSMGGANLGGVLTQIDYAKDITSGGSAAGITALSGFEDVSLRARYRVFNDFLSEAVNNNEIPLSTETSADATTQVYMPLLGAFSFGLSYVRDTYADSTRVPKNTYSVRGSKGLWGLGFTNTVDYINDSDKTFQDTFGVQTRVGGIDLRMTGIYEFKPIQQFNDANIVANYRLTRTLSGQTQIDKNMSSSSSSLGQGFYMDFESFRLGLNGEIGNRGEYSAGLVLSASIGHNPVTKSWETRSHSVSDSGAIGGHVYVAQNRDTPFNDAAKDIPSAKIKINHVEAPAQDNGYFVAPVSSYEMATVQLDPASIADPLLTPVNKSYRVMTRPADTVIADFPLVPTTMIEGSLTLLDEQGNKTDVKDIVVELLDKNGNPVRRIITEFDGYFSFDKIEAGEYWLSVPDEALEVYTAVLDNKPHIVIPKIDEFITDQNIVLRQKPKSNTLGSVMTPNAGLAAKPKETQTLPIIPAPDSAAKPEEKPSSDIQFETKWYKNGIK